MKKKDFIAAVDELDISGKSAPIRQVHTGTGKAVHAALQAGVRAVIPGKQQARNLEPQMIVARKAALRALRRIAAHS